MVFIGTPFNANDPLYKAVESGAWTVSVFPICEKFPVTPEDFNGSWEDRFTYDYVKAEYDEAIALHKPENFNQELMLRIMSEEDRLIQDDDMVWYSRKQVMQNKSSYNFYITTDFATSAKKGADYSVLSVWAYNHNGDWMLVDGVCKQQLMDQNMNDLFRLVSMYKPLAVGVEVSGQQGGFIRWINNEMVTKNIFFNLASSKNSGEAGIRPVSDKLTRFNQILPLFKAKKIWFPEELKNTDYGRELVDELTNVSKKGFKSRHDDVSDTISMLSEIDAYKPTEEAGTIGEVFSEGGGIWKMPGEDDDFADNGSTVF
jgi:predicted phage terminase large subunit-like protein